MTTPKWKIARRVLAGAPGRRDKTMYQTEVGDRFYIVVATGFPSGWYGETQKWSLYRRTFDDWERLGTYKNAQTAKAALLDHLS